MARIKGKLGDGSAVRIDRGAVKEFFELRAQKADRVGPLGAVIYQDKHPELAVSRDAAEKALLTPKIGLAPQLRVLDVGCGNGRWATQVTSPGCKYLGADSSEGLIRLAQDAHRTNSAARFVVSSIDEITLNALGEADPFDRILVFGVLIYLNDDEVKRAVSRLPELASESCRIVVREPVGLGERLTIADHFSDDMDQTYNAIYRTEEELTDIFTSGLAAAGFELEDSGDVYSDPALNNRAETRQRWMIWQRSM